MATQHPPDDVPAALESETTPESPQMSILSADTEPRHRYTLDLPDTDSWTTLGWSQADKPRMYSRLSYNRRNKSVKVAQTQTPPDPLEQLQALIDILNNCTSFEWYGMIFSFAQVALTAYCEAYPDDRERVEQTVNEAYVEQAMDYIDAGGEGGDPDSIDDYLWHLSRSDPGVRPMTNPGYQVLRKLCEELAEKLRRYPALNPAKRLALPMDNASREMFAPGKQTHLVSLMESEERFAVDTKERPAAHIPTVYITLSLDAGAEPRRLTTWDQLVHDTICSMLARNPESMTITVPEICQTMTQRKVNQSENSTALDAVRESVEKMATIRAAVVLPIESRRQLAFVGASHILACAYMGVIYRGSRRLVDAYRFFEEPILYRYARTRAQVAEIPIAMLYNGALSATTAATTTIYYLARRVVQAQRAARSRHKGPSYVAEISEISYQTIAEHTGDRMDTKMARYRLRERVDTILDDWRRKGYITDYTQYKHRREIAGVLIDATPRNTPEGRSMTEHL